MSSDDPATYAELPKRQSRHQESDTTNRNGETQDAFRRAKASNTLNPELQAFVDQRLRQLQ